MICSVCGLLNELEILGVIESKNGLTCPERDEGEEEVAYWKMGSRREMVWDTNMSDVEGMRGYFYVHLQLEGGE